MDAVHTVKTEPTIYTCITVCTCAYAISYTYTYAVT